MGNKLKLTRVAPGFYKTSFGGKTYCVSQFPGGWWGWNLDVPGRAGHCDDAFSTKRECVEALTHFVTTH